MYGLDLMVNKLSLSLSYINLIADISEIFGVGLVASFLLLSLLSCMVFFHKNASSFIENNFKTTQQTNSKISSYSFFLKNLFRL